MAWWRDRHLGEHLMKRTFLKQRAGLLWLVGLAVVAVVAFTTRGRWWSTAQGWVQSTISGNRAKSSLDEHGEGAAHEDAHAGHDESTSLELSKQAQGNIGLTEEYLQPLKLQTFRKSITVPGIIVDRPGRTRVEVSTPMAGVITHVHAVQGEAVKPGTLLFEIRITAEELVSTQTDLLKSVGDLDVENREIARLTKVSESGAVSQKTLLERQYAREKLEVLMNAQREALRLRGLSERQIDDIATKRRLLRDLQIVAPSPDSHGAEELKLSRGGYTPASIIQQDDAQQDSAPQEAGHNDAASPSGTSAPLMLQEVLVHKGETVAAGTTLAVLADYSELYIEGRAFEQDAEMVAKCAERGWKIAASFDKQGHQSTRIENLDLIYSSSEIDPDSRSLSLFVRLPNEVARETPSPNGQTFLDWKYRPGRRLQLLVPVEEWVDQIVLPVEAIAREGAESFVFQQNGDHFDRVAVHVTYRDSTHVVLKSDGSIFPGDVVAQRGAHQMQMALKNKSGGGADPHAGHNH